MAVWKTIYTTNIVSDRWINLRADRFITSGGTTLDPYYVLTYPDWVHIVAIQPPDHCLLIRQYRYAAEQYSLELPCGAMSEKDCSPEAAANRELLEETGFSLSSAHLIASTYANPATHTNKVFVVVGTAIKAPKPPSPDPGEELSLERVPLSSLPSLCTSGAIIQSMHIASIFLALIHPLLGLSQPL